MIVDFKNDVARTQCRLGCRTVGDDCSNEDATMIVGERRGPFRYPSVNAYLFDFQIGDGFASHPSQGLGTLACLSNTRCAARRIDSAGNTVACPPSRPSTIPSVSPASLIATPPTIACERRDELTLNRATPPDGARRTSFTRASVAPMHVKTRVQQSFLSANRLRTKQAHTLADINRLVLKCTCRRGILFRKLQNRKTGDCVETDIGCEQLFSVGSDHRDVRWIEHQIRGLAAST